MLGLISYVVIRTCYLQICWIIFFRSNGISRMKESFTKKYMYFDCFLFFSSRLSGNYKYEPLRIIVNINY